MVAKLVVVPMSELLRSMNVARNGEARFHLRCTLCGCQLARRSKSPPGSGRTPTFSVRHPCDASIRVVVTRSPLHTGTKNVEQGQPAKLAGAIAAADLKEEPEREAKQDTMQAD
jgi:hypothetical protein